MSKFVSKQFKILLMLLFVIYLFFPSQVSAQDKEIDIYALDEIYENISIPVDLAQEYQFPEGENASYVLEGDSVTVSSNGLVKPVSEKWYLYNGYRTAIAPKPDDEEQPYATTIYYKFGTSTVKVITKTGKYLVTFRVKDYSINYMNQVLDNYIEENITEGLTNTEKLNRIVAFPAQYIYNSRYSCCEDMIIFGGGDCWASADAIMKLCEKVGFSAHIRYGVNDSGSAGSGHKNAAVLVDGKIYVGEAGYVGYTAPRSYHVREENTGFFVKSYTNGTVRLMQYDGFEDTVTIPETVDGNTINTIGEYALSSYRTWKDFTSVVFPDTINKIENYAFYNANTVENIDITKNITSIGEIVFCGCDNLKKINVDAENPSYADDNGVLYNKDKTKLLYYPGGGDDYYALCDSANEIADYAFCETQTLKILSIPASVNRVGNEAFRYCNIKKIYFSGDKPEFGSNILRYTYNTEIYYPENNSTWDGIENDAQFSNATLIKWNPENSLTECQIHGHDYTYGNVTDGKISAVCNKCNEETSFSVPTTFTPMWNNEVTSLVNSFGSYIPTFNPVGSDLKLKVRSNNINDELNKFIIESSDKSIIDVSREVDADEIIKLEVKKAGVVKFTIYPKYNPTNKYEKVVTLGGKGDLDISNAQVEFDDLDIDRGVARPNLVVIYNDDILRRGEDYSVEYGKKSCAVTVKITGLNVFENSELNISAPARHTPMIIHAVSATCTQTGLTQGSKCSVCGEIIKEQEIVPVISHTEVVVSGRPATCYSTGLTDGKKCSVCGKITKEQEVIPLAEHTEMVITGRPATCYSEGLTDGKKCRVCGETIKEQEVIPLADHTETVIAGRPATCYSTGLTDGKQCLVCGNITVNQTIIPKVSHTAGNPENENITEATCENQGFYDEVVYCSICHTELSRERKYTEEIGHDWGDWQVDTSSTCIQQGQEYRICKNNPMHIEYKNSELSSHQLVKIDAAASTCSREGNIEYYRCQVCGNLFKDETGINTLSEEDIVTAKIPHTPEKIEGTAPTCTQTGLTEGSKCQICDEILTKQEVIEKLPHTPEIMEGKPATCTSTGLTDGSRCLVCNEIIKKQEIIPKTSHSYGNWVITQNATIFVAGTKQHTCSQCGHVETVGINKLADNRIPISSASISLTNKIYTGKAVYPDLKIQINGRNLTAGKDYTVSYRNNIHPGVAIVVINGIGNYKNSVTKTFLISLNKVKIKAIKAGKKEVTVSWNKAKNISGYEIQYSKSSSFSDLKTIAKGKNTKKVKIKKLTSKKKYYIRIRTYKTISGKKYYSDWSGKKKVKVK